MTPARGGLGRRLVLVALGLGLAVLVLVAPHPLAGSPAAAGGAPCTGATGVTVVVDFGPLQGGTQEACVPGGAGQNAANVTVAGGFPVEMAQGQPFVCRISGQPDKDHESCTRTPPDDAFWGLFWSDGKHAWTFSNQGATSLTPKDGWSIGWRFQDGGAQDKPSEKPRLAAAASPTPKPGSSSPSPTRKPAATPRPAAPATSVPSASPAGAAASTAVPEASGRASAPSSPSAGRSTGPPRARASASTASPSEPPTEDPTEDPTGSADVADGSFATVTAGGDDGGDGTADGAGIATVAGLGGLSLLAGAAAVVTYRRGRP